MAFNASAIRAGKAVVEIGTDNGPLHRGLAAAEVRLKRFEGKANQIGNALIKAGAAGVAAMSGSLAMFAAFGDELNKASDRTGATVESLSKLKYAAEQSGVGLETVEAGLRGMARMLYDAKNGSTTATDALAALGISIGELEGLDPEEQFLRLSGALSQVKDESTQTALAMKVFGKSGVQLLPMLAAGREGIEALMKRAEELGLVFDKDTAQAATDLGDRIADLKDVAKSAGIVIGSHLAGDAQKFVEAATDAMKRVADWVRENRQLILVAAKVSAGLVASGVAMKGVAIAAAVLRVALTALSVHPIVAAMTVVAAGVLYVAGAFDEATTAADDYAAAQTRARESGDKLRMKHQEMFERLQALAEKEKLSNDEHEEAKRIVDILNAAYKGLGVSIDATTGKITAATKEQEALTAAMRKALIAEKQMEVQGIEKQISQIRKELSADLILSTEPRNKWRAEQDDARLKKWRQLDAVAQGMRAEIAALEGGASPLDNTLRTVPGPDDPVEAPAVNGFDLLQGEEAQRNAEMAQQEAEAHFNDLQRINAENAQLFRELQRLDIQASGLRPEEMQEAIRKLEQKFEREDAMKAGLDMELVDKRQAALDRIAAAAATSSPREGGFGTFSGTAAARQFGPQQDKQVKAIDKLAERIRDDNREILKAIKDNHLQVV